MQKIIKTIIRKVKVFLNGFIHTFKTDPYFVVLVIFAILVSFVSWIFSEYVNTIITIILVVNLIAFEAFNTAIEKICDLIDSNHNEKIKIIKDISAFSVGIILTALILFLIYELFPIISRLAL